MPFIVNLKWLKVDSTVVLFKGCQDMGWSSGLVSEIVVIYSQVLTWSSMKVANAGKWPFLWYYLAAAAVGNAPCSSHTDVAGCSLQTPNPVPRPHSLPPFTLSATMATCTCPSVPVWVLPANSTALYLMGFFWRGRKGGRGRGNRACRRICEEKQHCNCEQTKFHLV